MDLELSAPAPRGPDDPRRGVFDPASHRKSTAELVASRVEIEQAHEQAKDDDERAVLVAGMSSPSAIDQIGAAIMARLILARSMTHPELVRYVEHLQGRYKVAVGSIAYDGYKAGIPRDVFENEEKLRAELQTLAYRLRLAYCVSYIRDTHLGNIRLICFVSLLIILAMLMATVYLDYNQLLAGAYLNYLIVAIIGLGGAVTSIARRANQILSCGPLSEDPVVQVSALEQGASSLLVACITGPVFALVLLLLFMSGGLELNGLTPHFTIVPVKGPPGAVVPKDYLNFMIFHDLTKLNDATDGAKLAVWAFIAGFAEQFVPDVLDRFTKGTDK